MSLPLFGVQNENFIHSTPTQTPTSIIQSVVFVTTKVILLFWLESSLIGEIHKKLARRKHPTHMPGSNVYEPSKRLLSHGWKVWVREKMKLTRNSNCSRIHQRQRRQWQYRRRRRRRRRRRQTVGWLSTAAKCRLRCQESTGTDHRADSTLNKAEVTSVNNTFQICPKTALRSPFLCESPYLTLTQVQWD